LWLISRQKPCSPSANACIEDGYTDKTKVSCTQFIARAVPVLEAELLFATERGCREGAVVEAPVLQLRVAERLTSVNPDQSGVRGVRLILQQQASTALDLLSRNKLTDAEVHAARKELKKARATLRLLRAGLSERVYRRENATLRDAARPLSAARDGRVMLETLDELIEDYGAPARAVPLGAFRNSLRSERREARRALTPATIQRSRRSLRQLRERAARWRIADRGWPIIGVGLKRIYDKGRKAMVAAQSSRSIEDLHEWRKQVKYLWHQLQVLAPMWPGLIGELADQAHKLANYLGDDHDLAVLRGKVLAQQDAFQGSAGREALLALVDRCRDRLQEKAFLLGKRIYEERPAAFQSRFGKYWEDWRTSQQRRSMLRQRATH
jgi:CHAD domain-containing protein